MPIAALSLSFTLGIISSALAQTPIIVDELGADGWANGDTRDDGNVTFGVLAGRGALMLSTTTPTSIGTDKATLDKRSTPFAGTVSPFDDIAFRYQWYRFGNSTVATAALKLGVETSLSNPSSSNPTWPSARESEFDLIFVYEPYHQKSTLLLGGQWSDTLTVEEIDLDQGRFWLVNLSTNLPDDPFYLPYGHGQSAKNVGGVARQSDLRTLAQWQGVLSDEGLTEAKIVSVQLGIGSSNPNLTVGVDFLEFGSGNSFYRWEFASTTNGVTTTTAQPDGKELIDGSLDALSLPFAGGSVDPKKVVAIAPQEVEGDTDEAKRDTLDAIADEIEHARLKADKQPGAAAVRLQWVLDFILGDPADPSDDLIVGGIGASIRGLVDEAKRALKPGN